MSVLIITAVRQEAALLEQALSRPSRVGARAFPHVEGLIGGLPVAICVAGVGKINAAAACAAMIERRQPQLVINVGCAGAYTGSGLGIGALAVAASEFLGDEGVITSAGWLDLLGMKLPSLVQGERRYYNEIPLSSQAVERARQLADRCGISLACGGFVTVSTCSGSEAQAEVLAGRFGALCENMEGAAIALTCLRYGIDCLEIRGISNLVEERNMAAWDIARAVEEAQRFVLKYLENRDW
ncbi:futalosine hydrolase [Geobacter sp. SVR]|uniref:futalosine hydrolase n=1 Tax=Geobacter sp. SVR TaxID=2495594 RepID=UPI00143EF646|nr:futalosine hydrolase [Geobacter sp. SVR]BCS52331.1 futalosine hydrolase [Geobacter sp. SVR]GCF85010.1 futalosine hydrolase [Geobacter sp. SVR]